MAEARVTVAIPTWNRAGLLRQTLESVLGQTLGDLEVVVADNGSTDGTAEVVRGVGDPRVHHQPVPRNIGFVPNLNRCLASGSAPHVMVLHDDDLLRPTSLERLVPVLETSGDVGLVYSNYATIGPAGEPLQPRIPIAAAAHERGPEFIARSMAGYGRVHMSAAVIRRAALGRARFEEDDRNYLDLGLWLRLALRSAVAYVDEPLSEIRMHGGSASASSAMYAADALLDTETVEQFRLLQHAKARFLDEHGRRLPDADALRRSSRAFVARQLAVAIDRGTRSRRSPGEVVRLTAAAVKVEPLVLTQPRLGRVALGSVARRRRRRVAAPVVP